MKILIIFILFAQGSLALSETESNGNDIRSWELRTAPVAILADWYTLDLSYRLTKYISFGPAAVLYDSESTTGNIFLPTYNGKAIGWQANYYFNSIFHNSMYLGIHSYYEAYRSYTHAMLGYQDLKGFRTNLTLGYQIKNSNLNFLFGLGVEYQDHQVTTSKEFQTQTESHQFTTNPIAEIKIGIEI